MTKDKKILIFLLVIVGIPLIFWGLMTQFSFRAWVCRVTYNNYCYDVMPFPASEAEERKKKAEKFGINF